jgi:hypothetical protein
MSQIGVITGAVFYRSPNQLAPLLGFHEKQEHRIRQIFARHFLQVSDPCVNSLADALVPLEARLSFPGVTLAQTFLSPRFSKHACVLRAAI